MKEIKLIATQTTFKNLNVGDNFTFIEQPIGCISGEDLIIQRLHTKVDDTRYKYYSNSTVNLNQEYTILDVEFPVFKIEAE